MRSSIANKRPAPATLLEGQAAVNLNSTEPGLYFKLSSGVLTKVGPTCVNSSGSAPNATPSGSSGNAVGEQWLDARSALASPVLKVYDGSVWRTSSGFTVSDTTGDYSLAKGVTVRNLISNGTGANGYVRLNVGPTTDQTSITAASGMIRYDSTTNEFVGYYGGGSAGWRIIGPVVSPAGDGQINVNAGTGITITGDNATANQTGNTTRTVTLDTTYADGRYVSKTGDTMTGLLTLSGDPTANLMAATKQYVDNNSQGAPGNGQINVSAGTGLTASGTQATANQSGNTTRTLELDLTYSDGRYVAKAGDTMTGLLTLSGNPTSNLMAATKQYVDSTALAGNGQINVDAGTGLSVSGTQATANQSGNTTRTLSLDTTYTDGRYVNKTGDTMTGALNVPAGASGTQAPRVQEVVKKSGDTMTGDLTFVNAAQNLAISENSNGYPKLSTSNCSTEFGNSSFGSTYLINKADTAISPAIAYWTDSTSTNKTANSFSFKWENGSGQQMATMYMDYGAFSVAGTQIMVLGSNNIRLNWSSPNLYALVDNVVSITLGSSSDYRLKENITPLSGASDLVKQLKPCTFTMKETTFKEVDFEQDSAVVHGFIAHEIGEVIPDAEVGTKDDPDYLQSVNLSPVVSVLTKALQESITRIETLEARLDAAGA